MEEEEEEEETTTSPRLPPLEAHRSLTTPFPLLPKALILDDALVKEEEDHLAEAEPPYSPPAPASNGFESQPIATTSLSLTSSPTGPP